ALGNPVTLGNHCHLAAFGFHLRQQRCLLLGRPLPAPLNPRDDLDFCQRPLLLERQNATPGDTSLGGSGRDFYTRLTSRLPSTRRSAWCTRRLLVCHSSRNLAADALAGTQRAACWALLTARKATSSASS